MMYEVPRRVHRPPIAHLAMAVIVNGLVIMICPTILIILTAGSAIRIFIGVGVAFLLVAAYFILLASQIRVITTPEGIEYRQVGYGVKSSWDNIDRILTVKSGIVEREGLLLKEPNLEPSWWYRLVPDRHKEHRGRFIPFTPLMPNWRGGSLGLDIRQYAPHLFDEEDAEFSE